MAGTINRREQVNLSEVAMEGENVEQNIEEKKHVFRHVLRTLVRNIEFVNLSEALIEGNRVGPNKEETYGELLCRLISNLVRIMTELVFLFSWYMSHRLARLLSACKSSYEAQAALYFFMVAATTSPVALVIQRRRLKFSRICGCCSIICMACSVLLLRLASRVCLSKG